MELFVYLNKEEWADAWVNGGEVPINTASYYSSDSRGGVFTPDENFTVESSSSFESMPLVSFSVSNGGSIKNVSVTNCSGPNGPIPDYYLNEYSHWDGWIMCFCTKQSGRIARKFGGKKACVQIIDFNRLKSSLDEQVGLVSEAKHCQYTKGHRRGHFIKSDEDSWQKEYRLFWKSLDAETRMVQLPPGIGKLLATY